MLSSSSDSAQFRRNPSCKMNSADPSPLILLLVVVFASGVASRQKGSLLPLVEPITMKAACSAVPVASASRRRLSTLCASPPWFRWKLAKTSLSLDELLLVLPIDKNNQSRFSGSGYCLNVLRVAFDVLFDVDRFGPLSELMSGIVHRWAVFFIEEANILLFRLHRQCHRFGAITGIVVGSNGRDRGIPGIEGMEERRAGAQRMNKRETFMHNALLDQRGEFLRFGRVATGHEAHI